MAAEPHRFGKIAEDLIASLRRIPSEDPGRSRVRPTASLADLVSELRAKHGIGQEITEHALRARWPEIVGPANASYSHALRIEAGRTLIVQATHAVVRNELFMNKEEIVERLRKVPGCEGIMRIRLVQG